MNIKGLIYCRVSSKKQVKEGNGLSSQEKRCRDYATNTLGIEVEKVFNDEGVSGGVFERKSVINLFKYIDNNKNQNYMVIFEDLNRLSRDIQVHNLLKAEFKKRGVELASPNFQFEHSPEGIFRENMSVSMAQYEKDKNSQRVNHRMRARLEDGYWCFKVPIGYKFTNNSKGGKEIVIDESKYKIVKSALTKYANDELGSINDVARFLNDHGLSVGNVVNGKVYNANLVSNMLKNVLYAGYLEFPKWHIERKKAQHKAIISIKTFEKIERKINYTPQNIVAKIESNLERIDKTNDFPLRGFLYCENSNQMISGAWSKGRSKKFPYYVYPRKSPLHGKSINRDKLHKDFEIYLKSIQPKEKLIDAFEKAVEIAKKNNKQYEVIYKKNLEQNLNETTKKIDTFLNRIGKTNNDLLIENYEKQIEDLTIKKNEIIEKMQNTIKHDGTALKRKLKLARNALSIRENSSLEKKKNLLKNIFPNGIPINEKKQVGTPTFSLVYHAFSLGKRSECLMVDYINENLNSLLK